MTPAGSFAANALGLYDLSGNVWEWCQDWYASGNPDRRAMRGGSWFVNDSTNLSSSYRNYGTPSSRDGSVGFRVVLEVGSDG